MNKYDFEGASATKELMDKSIRNCVLCSYAVDNIAKFSNWSDDWIELALDRGFCDEHRRNFVKGVANAANYQVGKVQWVFFLVGSAIGVGIGLLI